MPIVNGRVPKPAALMFGYNLIPDCQNVGSTNPCATGESKELYLPVRVRTIRAVVDRNGRITLVPVGDQLQLADVQGQTQSRALIGP